MFSGILGSEGLATLELAGAAVYFASQIIWVSNTGRGFVWDSNTGRSVVWVSNV
jgi:hypothetical protein